MRQKKSPRNGKDSSRYLQDGKNNIHSLKVNYFSSPGINGENISNCICQKGYHLILVCFLFIYQDLLIQFIVKLINSSM